MRLLLWCSGVFPSIGGVEVLTARLVASLVQGGHEVAIVAPSEGPEASVRHEAGATVHRLPFYAALARRDAGAILELRRRVAAIKRSWAPDLVHVNAVHPSLVFHLDTPTPNPVVQLFTLHGWVALGTAEGSVLGRTIRTADWVAACSRSTLASARSAVPAIRSRSSVIYNGMDPPDCAPSPLSLDPPRLLCVGRLVEQKGFDDAIEALALLVPRFPGARLVIAGDGPERPALAQKAAALGVSDRVSLVGWVPPQDVPQLLDDATVLVVPSKNDEEGFGLVALEAASMARPVVASRAGGLPEVVATGATGLLVDPCRPRLIADSVASLLANPATARKMGLAARDRARRLFGWSACFNKYEQLYAQLLEERASDRRGHPMDSGYLASRL